MEKDFNEFLMEERKKFLTDFWDGKSKRLAYRITGYEKNLSKQMTTFTLGEQFKSPAKMLATQESLFNAMLEIKHDEVPAYFPYLGVGVFASAFGCEVEFPENEQPWTKPIIQNANDVYKLNKPSVRDGLLGQVIELTEYFIKNGDSRFPIKITDVQGPLDTASLIWDYEDFLMALYTNPKEVHLLLSMITELIVDFVKLQKSIVGERFLPNHCPGFWMPYNFGIPISDDLVAIVSPDLYREFGKPYNEVLASEFGGLHIHSCGNFTFNLDNLRETSGLRTLDLAVSECPVDKIIEKLGDKVALSLRWGLNKDLHFRDAIEYVDYTFDKIKDVDPGKIFLNIDRKEDNKTGDYREVDIEKIYECLNKKGILLE